MASQDPAIPSPVSNPSFVVSRLLSQVSFWSVIPKPLLGLTPEDFVVQRVTT